MKKTARTEIGLRIILVLIIIFTFATSNAQNVKTGPDGNYIAVTKEDTATDQPTGKHYTDKSGTRYKVYISARGKLYVIRTSKNGILYKYYLKP